MVDELTFYQMGLELHDLRQLISDLKFKVNPETLQYIEEEQQKMKDKLLLSLKANRVVLRIKKERDLPLADEYLLRKIIRHDVTITDEEYTTITNQYKEYLK